VQVVNLLVTPEQAEILNLATEQRIQLVLRNPSDQDVVHTPGASQANVFEGGAPRPVPHPDFAPRPRPRLAEAPPPPRPRNVTVEVFAGDRRSESTFQDPDSMVRP
jgi:pilus assembly protein CpaB